MADTSPKTFPGVYTTITDKSFLTPQLSRFRPAFIGVTSKGPLNVPTTVRSLREFINLFGQPVTFDTDATTGAPDGTIGHYMADAVRMVADYTNDMTIVRVGNQYADYESASGELLAGNAGATSLSGLSVQAASDLHALKAQYGALYLRFQQSGKKTTSNAEVTSNSGTVVIDTPLADTYTGATISYSTAAKAATKAEGTLFYYSYGTAMTEYGYVTGAKGAFQFEVQQDGSASGVPFVPGAVYKIAPVADPYTAITYEVRVKSVSNTVVSLETTDDSQTGYQAVALQDNYSSSGTNGPLARVYRVNGSATYALITAKTEGEWANGSGSQNGLYTRVRPGSAPGTKKIEVYEDGALVETHDNLESSQYLPDGVTANPNYYTTRLTASQYFDISVTAYASDRHPANTAAPWDASLFGVSYTATGTVSMPTGAINAGTFSVNSTTYTTGGQFTGGYNGENPSEQDFVGTYLPADDIYTGISALKDTDNINANVLAVPADLSQFGSPSTSVTSGVAVMQALAETAYRINAIAFVDVPPNLKATQAVDWHNGKGAWLGRTRVDTANLALYYNWITITDSFTGLPKLVPPTIGALRTSAFTFQREKPWYAWAGENRGFIPEASAVQYERISGDVKETLQSNGNCINPILQIRGSRYIYGDRTMQRSESKLTAAHSVVLVNYILSELTIMARRFVFDPNDPELLVQIRLATTEVLDKVKNERGLEDYSVVVDSRNNTADTRNRREVIVDFAIIPTDVAERIWLNATVRESGAELNQLSN